MAVLCKDISNRAKIESFKRKLPFKVNSIIKLFLLVKKFYKKKEFVQGMLNYTMVLPVISLEIGLVVWPLNGGDIVFQRIKEQDTIYEKVVKSIKSSIAEGKLKPGDKLPAERALAQMLGISRTSLRIALKLLAAEGLVEIKHGKGVFIAEKDNDDIIKKFSEKIFIEDETLKDFFEIRKVLETQAAIWAVEKGTQEQIANLEDIVNSTLAELNSNKELDYGILAEHNFKFHTCLAEACGNPVLLRIMENLIDLFNETRTHSLLIRPYNSIKEHLEIVQAIKDRRPEKAGDAMLVHLRNVEKDIFPNT